MPISSINISFEKLFECARHSRSEKLIVDMFSLPSSTTKSSNTRYPVRYKMEISVRKFSNLLHIIFHPIDCALIRNDNISKCISSSGIYSFVSSSTPFFTSSSTLVDSFTSLVLTNFESHSKRISTFVVGSVSSPSNPFCKFSIAFT